MENQDKLSITLIKGGWYFPWTLVWTPGPLTLVFAVFLLAAIASLIYITRRFFGWN